MVEYEKISVSSLKPGMRVAKIVENQFGASLVTPGMVLDDDLINKLSKLGIKYITIFKESEKKLRENIDKFNIKYQKNVSKMKNVFKSVKLGKKLNFDEIKEIVDDIAEIDTNRDIISILSQVKDVDEYTYTHSINVGLLAMMFGRWLNLLEKDIKHLLYAGLLHDIGKYRIPVGILQKKGKLTVNEFKLIKKHTIYGYKLVKECNFIPNKVARGVLLHHERNDGSGYPLGLTGEKIPFIAKLLAIVDTYDAMTSDRVYKTHRPPFDVFKLLEKSFRVYDISLSKLFMNEMSQYYLGEQVALSNGQMGEIVFINPNHIPQPIVKVGSFYIDLYKSNLELKDVFIKS